MSRKARILVLLLVGLGFYLCLPTPLFKAPTSTLLYDSKGELLSAQIAKDEQWRFPRIDSVPAKIEKCVLYFEDEYFYLHPGVNPVSLSRAVWQNLSSGKIKSGGSTLSMQVIRLSRKNPPRTYLEKMWELLLAIRLEFSYSKKEILRLYLTHAPYGGNVVGLETASWRYFKRAPNQLSWSESAMLAVLPNSPSLIHLGRNRKLLAEKRNRLLQKLLKNSELDSMEYSLSLMEKIPSKPKSLPNYAYHLLQRAKTAGFSGRRVITSVEKTLQQNVNQSVDRYVNQLIQNEIHNACAIVVSLKHQEVLAYVGNSQLKKARAPFVDLIQAPRSSGSILKPLLYARAIEKGIIHSTTLLKDIPISIDQFSPKNFNGEFEGLVPAGEALARSLNIPATLLLKEYGIAPFHEDLNHFGFSTINRSANNYGLTLVLGGAEVTLYDLAQFYAIQAQQLNEPTTKRLSIWKGQNQKTEIETIDNAAWHLVTEALTEVQRPGLNMDWKQYTSTRKVAWKTGTSHGFRDAWALGYDKNYLVAVWVGNADGEGRPGLTGASVAGPLLFDIFQYLPRSEWYAVPEYALKTRQLCAESGFIPNDNCPKKEVQIPARAKLSKPCQFHKSVLVNENQELVFRDCYQGPIKDTVIFSIDPVTNYYYTKANRGSHRPLKLAKSCNKAIANTLGIVYPTKNAKLIIPKSFSGQQEKVVLKAYHTESGKEIYWHLNEHFLGTTKEYHELSVHLPPGNHKLLVMDKNGNQSMVRFGVFTEGKK